MHLKRRSPTEAGPLVGNPDKPPSLPIGCERCWHYYQRDHSSTTFFEPRVVHMHLYSLGTIQLFAHQTRGQSMVLRALCGAQRYRFFLDDFPEETRARLLLHIQTILWERAVEAI